MTSIKMRTFALCLTLALTAMTDGPIRSNPTQPTKMSKGVLLDIAEHPIEFSRTLWITISSS